MYSYEKKSLDEPNDSEREVNYKSEEVQVFIGNSENTENTRFKVRNSPNLRRGLEKRVLTNSVDSMSTVIDLTRNSTVEIENQAEAALEDAETDILDNHSRQQSSFEDDCEFNFKSKSSTISGIVDEIMEIGDKWEKQKLNELKSVEMDINIIPISKRRSLSSENNYSTNVNKKLITSPIEIGEIVLDTASSSEQEFKFTETEDLMSSFLENSNVQPRIQSGAVEVPGSRSGSRSSNLENNSVSTQSRFQNSRQHFANQLANRSRLMTAGILCFIAIYIVMGPIIGAGPADVERMITSLLALVDTFPVTPV